MDDLIRRQDAIDAVEDWFFNTTDLRQPEEVLRCLPSAQQWIPCSERLPEEEEDVLVTRRFLGVKNCSKRWNDHIPPTTYVEVAQYFDGTWTALSDEYKIARNRHTDPIAWMPLPNPYKESEEKK